MCMNLFLYIKKGELSLQLQSFSNKLKTVKRRNSLLVYLVNSHFLGKRMIWQEHRTQVNDDLMTLSSFPGFILASQTLPLML